MTPGSRFGCTVVGTRVADLLVRPGGERDGRARRSLRGEIPCLPSFGPVVGTTGEALLATG